MFNNYFKLKLEYTNAFDFLSLLNKIIEHLENNDNFHNLLEFY